MPRGALEMAFQEAWDSCGPESRKAVALAGWERDGDKKVSRVFNGGDLNPSFALLEALLRANAWPVLDAIARLTDTRWESAPRDPAVQRQQAIDGLERLIAEADDVLARLRDFGEAMEETPRVGRRRATG